MKVIDVIPTLKFFKQSSTHPQQFVCINTRVPINNKHVNGKLYFTLYAYQVERT